MTWTDFIEHLLPHFPKLTSVELGYNRLERLADETAEQKLPTTNTKLSTVNFDGNRLNNWVEICLSLAKFPTWVVCLCGAFESDQTWSSVNHLILSLNGIEIISPLPKSHEESNGSASSGLAHIKSLTLSSNNLRSWSDINTLAEQCPMVETLNITGNPIVEGRSHSSLLVTGRVLTPIVVS